MKLLSVVFILLLFSCAPNSNIPKDPYRGIATYGPDTYTLSLSSVKGYAVARTATLLKANGFCKSRNQIFMLTNEIAGGGGSCTLVFRCLNQSDQELAKQKWESKPEPETAAIDQAVISPKVIASDVRFEKLASGVVRDTQNGIDWYAGPDKNTDWEDAKSWVAYLMVDGGGWRMPTRSELKSLYQKGIGPRNITSLLETTGWWIWSGETGYNNTLITSGIWALDLSDGRELLDRRSNSIYKRAFAVRSRK